MFIVWQKSSILFRVFGWSSFLRGYTHINIYCKSISFRLRLWTDNMHGFFSRVTLWFCCVCKPRGRRNCSLFFSFFSSLVFFSRPSFLFLFFMPAYMLYLYTMFFHFCHCNLYQQSRCLNNANPFFIQSRVQFFYPHHNCLLPQRNSWELGDKAQTHSVWW